MSRLAGMQAQKRIPLLEERGETKRLTNKFPMGWVEVRVTQMQQTFALFFLSHRANLRLLGCPISA